MRFTISSATAFLAASASLTTAAPVDGVDTNTSDLAIRDGQIPADQHTSACKFYSNFPAVWTYEARIRELDMTPDDLCPKLEEAGKEDLMCGLMIIKQCDRDINDPQVKRWKFEVRAQCTGEMVAEAIEKATGQSGVKCGIVYNSDDWP